MFNTFSNGYTDRRGHWHPPESDCCGARLVYFNFVTNAYVHWDGYIKSQVHIKLEDLRCEKCNRGFSKTKKFIVLIELPENMENIDGIHDAMDTLYAIDDGLMHGKVTIKKVGDAEKIVVKNLTGLDS